MRVTAPTHSASTQLPVSRVYSQAFFAEHRGWSLNSANAVVPWVVEVIQPTSILDVGCGAGTWLAAFRKHGVRDVLGIDGDWMPRRLLEIPADCFRCQDLSQPMGSLGQFDLVISLEVAEHLPPESAGAFVSQLVAAGPVVLFSAAIPGQGGTGHLNEQWLDYWISVFEQHQFQCVDCLRGRFWDDRNVARWYSQNMCFFVQRARLADYPELLRAEPKYSLGTRAIVHPRSYLAKAIALERAADPRNLSLKQLLQAFPKVIRKTLTRKVRKFFGAG